MKEALSEIIQLATVDSEPWVLMVADILKSFPETGSLNLDLEEQNPNVQDILGELREKGGGICDVCLLTRLLSINKAGRTMRGRLSQQPAAVLKYLSCKCGLSLLSSEWVWGLRHASFGVPVPKQECINHLGGPPYTPCQTFPAEEEAQECNSQGRAATEM